MPILDSQMGMFIHDDPLEHPNDRGIFSEVHLQDCYKIRELHASGFSPRVVVDIGAHIGTFSQLAAAIFKPSRLLAFEPVEVHYKCLLRNVPSPPMIAVNKAVVGFLGRETGHNVYWSNDFERSVRRGEIKNALSVLDLLSEYQIESIDMLKIDCEQGEVNIFREMASIGLFPKIDVIAGEWHFDVAKREVVELLEPTHHVAIVDEGMWNLFFATRRT